MHKAEYGGYIEFEYFHGQAYHPLALPLNSGRHCVEYLIRARNIQTLYLPYFLCSSVKDICDKCQVRVAYYHTDRRFMPVFQLPLEDGAWLYVVNYYGQLTNEELKALQRKHGRIIVDNVQAFFQMPVPGLDTTYTCRKFFGVADGGYLYTDAKLAEALPVDQSYDRMQFLFGRMEVGANAFYAQYAANNRQFSAAPLKQMSPVTRNIMQGLDYGRIKSVREENFAALHAQLGGLNQLDLRLPEGAFMYPLYIRNGAEIRKLLQQKKIYIPTLWPSVFDICTEADLEYDMARNILPLPVDQRYDLGDMDYLAKEIKACIV